jgi:hypothetical protein
MGAPRFVVGIDLGTTHTAVAYTPIDAPDVRIFEVPQLVSPGEVVPRSLLPSALYRPADGELPAQARALPWPSEDADVVGELAARRGAEVPGRYVASAKSWLCHDGVDRQAEILPWGAPDGVPRISPVDASARYLAHIRAAWDAAHPDAALAEQEVVLTVPASFDEVARELTVEAARRAGFALSRLRLLEEPQAALYDWLLQNRERLAEAGGEARLALVVDVGGGTTDLTLVQIDPVEGDAPKLTRIAVGDHLMLGGDNMDAALARFVEQALGDGRRLDAAEWSSLMHSARRAKEALLGADPPQQVGVSLQRRGAKLVGGTRTHAVAREDAARLLLDGFLPKTGRDEIPARARRTALAELGLPYATDAAISRHVCAFLRRHVQAAAESGVPVFDGLPKPDAVLLNGGVFNAPAIVERLSEILAGWYEGAAVPLLQHASLDLAVARGAAWYGLARRGFGVKIGGGAARGYYVGVEGEGGAKRAFCVVPRGMEEGTEAKIPGRDFSLVLGRPVAFPLYSSTGDRHDALGEVVDLDEDLTPLPPLHTVLRAEGEQGEIPVRLSTALTEIGTLELSLHGAKPPARRWRLEFSVRGDDAAGGGAAVAPIDALPRRFEEARALVELCYGRAAKPVEPREIKNLWRSLEKILGRRDGWSSAANRELWGIVWGGAKKRRRTADHERVWFQLSGFGLRPGFGAPLDAWRVGEIWSVFEAGVQYTTEAANWSEWWILWRRIAGGLSVEQQMALFESARPWLEPQTGRVTKKPKGPRAQGHDEMVRMVASLERLPAPEKVAAAGWVLHRLASGEGGRSWWPIGRLGARQPFHGSAHDVVPPGEAAGWLEQLLDLDWKRADGAAFAAAQIARRTGDRRRDLDDGLRETVAGRLEAFGAPPSWIASVREVAALTDQDEVRVFGDSLPAGLKLG